MWGGRWALLCIPVLLVGCGGSAGGRTASDDGAPTAPTERAVITSVDVGPDLEAVALSARGIVRAYYRAIADRDYETAWSRLSSAMREALGPRAQWESGYHPTRSVAVTSIAATASDENHVTVSFAIRAKAASGCAGTVAQRFEGHNRLVRSRGRWEIRSANLRQTSGGSPVSCDRGESAPSADATRGAPASNEDDTSEVCFDAIDIPAVTIPAVTIPATTVPAVTIPAMTIGSEHYPARRYPARRYPARHYPARRYPAKHYPARCVAVPRGFSNQRSTILDEPAYPRLDASYSPPLTRRYWDGAGGAISRPDYTASGFGELNAAGYPKNQYVRPYVRRDGTFVSGYWRNSPSDGLPTCRVISC